MNWEAISAVGEIVGAVGVIISLIYLALQVRDNTRSAVLTAVNDAIGEYSDQARMIASTPDLAQIVLRGHESLSNLTPEERMRFDSVMEIFFNLLERWITNCRRAGMDQEQIDVSEVILQNRFENAGVREWWIANRAEYPVTFAAWVDSAVEEP